MIALIIASINPFNYIGIDTPGVFVWAFENKFYAAMMIFFLANAVETQLVSTGAFEISVDNMPVWSKIESGRIPQPPELFQIIETHLKLNSGQDSIPMEQLWSSPMSAIFGNIQEKSSNEVIAEKSILDQAVIDEAYGDFTYYNTLMNDTAVEFCFGEYKTSPNCLQKNGYFIIIKTFG